MAGLREINASIDQQEKEHNWLFIPSKSIWVDNTMSSEATVVEPDRYVHIFLSHLFPCVETVHTHPDASVRQLSEDEPWAYSKNYLLEAALPSVNDLIGHYQMTARTAPQSKQISSIVSHYGITSFSFNERPSRTRSFHTRAYDRFIHDDSNPSREIFAALGRLSQNALNGDESPVLSIDFELLR
jgi:hypothetical protein